MTSNPVTASAPAISPSAILLAPPIAPITVPAATDHLEPAPATKSMSAPTFVGIAAPQETGARAPKKNREPSRFHKLMQELWIKMCRALFGQR